MPPRIDPDDVMSPPFRYNQVYQKSSHNSFGEDEGLYDQILYWRVRSVEVDVHINSGLLRSDGVVQDWFVYHFAGNIAHPITQHDESSVNKLSNVLDIFRGIDKAIPNHEVITVFFELKDSFEASDGHSADDLETLLKAKGPQNIFKPTGVSGDWPELSSLRGNWIYVLMGDDNSLTSYALRPNRLCFVAHEADDTWDQTVRGEAQDGTVDDLSAGHPWSNTEFIIANIELLEDDKFDPSTFPNHVVRTYASDDDFPWFLARNSLVHHIATNEINSYKNSWSKTNTLAGYPFQPLRSRVQFPAGRSEQDPVISIGVKSSDISGTSDSFFYYAPEVLPDMDDLSLRFFISASNCPADRSAKGYVMARESDDPMAAYFAVGRFCQGGRPHVQFRLQRGENTSVQALNGFHDEDFRFDTLVFFRLDMTNGGKRATGFLSIDGSDGSWNEIFAQEFSMPLLLRGLAASSGGRDTVGFKFGNIGATIDFSSWRGRTINRDAFGSVDQNRFPTDDLG